MPVSKNDELFHLTSAGNIVKVKATSDERRGMVSIEFQDTESNVSSFDVFRTMRAAEIAANNRRA